MKNRKKKRQLLQTPNGEDKVLLHSCCAPCACSIMETLKTNKINCTVFFYNPNIDTEKEYIQRKEENIRYAQKLEIPFIDGDYLHDNKKWMQHIAGHETDPERGERCSLCFYMRLLATAEYAFNNGFHLITSSLGISRWKNFEEVCKCGIKAATNYKGLSYWTHNWRKNNGSTRMYEIAAEENFYRQNYCGCIFSKK